MFTALILLCGLSGQPVQNKGCEVLVTSVLLHTEEECYNYVLSNYDSFQERLPSTARVEDVKCVKLSTTM